MVVRRSANMADDDDDRKSQWAGAEPAAGLFLSVRGQTCPLVTSPGGRYGHPAWWAGRRPWSDHRAAMLTVSSSVTWLPTDTHTHTHAHTLSFCCSQNSPKRIARQIVSFFNENIIVCFRRQTRLCSNFKKRSCCWDSRSYCVPLKSWNSQRPIVRWGLAGYST